MIEWTPAAKILATPIEGARAAFEPARDLNPRLNKYVPRGVDDPLSKQPAPLG